MPQWGPYVMANPELSAWRIRTGDGILSAAVAGIAVNRKPGRPKLPVEITNKIWAEHWFRSGGKYITYQEWCEREAQRINETSDSRMAYVQYTQEGIEGIKCQVMDANLSEPMPSNMTQTRRAVNDFQGQYAS